MVYCTNWVRLRDAKKHTIKAFLVIQRWSNIPNEYQSFIFVTRVTRLIHNAGKYLLISIYPLPTHPTHNFTHKNGGNLDTLPGWPKKLDKQRVLMHGHQGWNVRHGLCHICMIYVYVWVVYSFCLFCCLFIIVTTQFVALYKPCKPKPKPSTYDPPDNHPLAEIQRPILRPEPKQQICHQHANTDHFGK